MDLNKILERALTGEELSRADLVRLLSPAGPEETEALFAAARSLRNRHSGPDIFIYGFVYLSTYCRNNCRFCAWRGGNPGAPHYRKSREEILKASLALAGQGVNLVDLTMGEDPRVDEPEFMAELAALAAEVKAGVSRPIMISPGVLKPEFFKNFKAAGVDWYACYQETHDGEFFRTLRPGQDYEKRLAAKSNAKAAGLLVEDGVLCGAGESLEQLADSILAMKELGAAQVRAMGFVHPRPEEAGRGGWLAAPDPAAGPGRELLMIAALRLAMPDRLIPASLDVDGLAGLSARLQAGANVVTSLVPADQGLAGVAQASLDIDNGSRSLDGVRPVLAKLGLRPAGQAVYEAWLDNAKAVCR